MPQGICIDGLGGRPRTSSLLGLTRLHGRGLPGQPNFDPDVYDESYRIYYNSDMTHLQVIHEAPTVEEYNNFRVAVGWKALDPSAVRAALDRSLYLSCVRDGPALLACGRAVGDGLYVYLQDIMVLPSSQRGGLGTLIVEDLLRQTLEHMAVGGYCGLMALKGTEDFYSRFGFKSQAATDTAMGFYVQSKEGKGQE